MKKEKLVRVASVSFIVFSAFCLLMVSLMAFVNPQSVMDLVSVKLNNNDAYNALKSCNDLLITGATGTNVADLQILLLHP